MNNPFELVTASKLSAAEAIDLWCDDNRLDRVRGGESCFINGNRGTGKSMLFRVLQRDCQELLFPDGKLEFLSVYFAVRDSDLMIEEFALMQAHRQKSALSESHLILLVVRQLLVELLKTPDAVPEDIRDQFQQLLMDRIVTAYEFSEVTCPEVSSDEFEPMIKRLIELLDLESSRLVNHVLRQLYEAETGYSGPLFFFDGFLGPITDFLMNGTGCRLFILIDDADDLPCSHTVVLNSWIARRRRSVVFKVSTMYGYKTFETRSGSKIQQPHDFIQYDIASRFLEYDSEDYVDLVRRICIKRLKQAGVESDTGGGVDPESFFPRDCAQDARMDALRASLTATYERKFSGRSVRDNVYRHLTSEYMKELNRHRSLRSYCYAGFRTLAVLSAGLVRDFIICAQHMYDDASRDNENNQVLSIPPSIQNRVVRDYADSILFEVEDARKKRSGTDADWKAIANLIKGLGATFKGKMLSSDSERRVFSFAFQSRPNADVERLLELAISEGYLVGGFISKKEGIGRRRLYVLTRRVGPAFSLDVSAYSGYLSLEPSAIEEVMCRGVEIGKPVTDERQMKLPFGSIGPDGDWLISDPDGRGRLVRLMKKNSLIATASFEKRSTYWVRKFIDSGGDPDTVFLADVIEHGDEYAENLALIEEARCYERGSDR